MEFLCRICLKTNETCCNIFESFKNEKLISESLIEFAPVKIQKEDGFPDNICKTCLDKLIFVYDFKQMIIESNGKLLGSQYSIDTKREIHYYALQENFLKEEIVDVKSDVKIPLHFGSDDAQNESEDTISGACHDTEIKQEDALEEHKISIITTDATDIFRRFKDENEVSMDKATQTDPLLYPKRIETKEKLKLSDNADCKRIMESDLTPRERLKERVLCTVCNKTYCFGYYLDRHIHTHTGNLPFQCEVCDLRFPKEHFLKRHMLMHFRKKEYKCEECGACFMFMHKLNLHKARHSNERPYKCDLCEKSFKLPIALKNHQILHKNPKGFVCEDCGKAFTHKSELRDHQTRHLEVKPFACDTCGRRFAHKKFLKAHQRSHVAVKPYPCAICGKRFVYRHALRRHIMVHTGTKPYPCHVCGKHFRFQSNVRAHMRVHTGEKPFACSLCCSKYKYSSHLTKHMEVHKKVIVKEETE